MYSLTITDVQNNVLDVLTLKPSIKIKYDNCGMMLYAMNGSNPDLWELAEILMPYITLEKQYIFILKENDETIVSVINNKSFFRQQKNRNFIIFRDSSIHNNYAHLINVLEPQEDLPVDFSLDCVVRFIFDDSEKEYIIPCSMFLRSLSPDSVSSMVLQRPVTAEDSYQELFYSLVDEISKPNLLRYECYANNILITTAENNDYNKIAVYFSYSIINEEITESITLRNVLRR